MTLSLELLVGLVAGIVIAVIGLLILRKRPALPKIKGASTAANADMRIEQLATRIGMVEKQMQLTRTDLEAAINQAVESMRADVKLIQMQTQSVRSGAETDIVDLAVRLAREGVEAEDIARRTGLPQDLIESIRVLHKIS
ncbi:MAG: hypothetical protein FGM26_01040 [Beijerinckiaceae bacterium]|nr:hypothetical protein [Beijerinckiaceae bacterium]